MIHPQVVSQESVTDTFFQLFRFSFFDSSVDGQIECWWPATGRLTLATNTNSNLDQFDGFFIFGDNYINGDLASWIPSLSVPFSVPLAPT